MRNHYGDTGNAQDYYYEIGNFDGEMCLMLVPKKYFDSCGYMADWHLRWMDPDFEQVAESQYVYCGLKTEQEVEQYLIDQGLVKKPSTGSQSSIDGISKNMISTYEILKKENEKNVEEHIKSVQVNCNGKKFESDELKDLILSMKDTLLTEIFHRFGPDVPMTNKKHWKRSFKKKIKLDSLLDELENLPTCCMYSFESYYDDGYISDAFIFDEGYFSNTSNVVIARQFQFEDEDCQVLILTNDKDNKLIALAHHSD